MSAPRDSAAAGAIEIRVEDLYKAFAADPVLAGVGLEVRSNDVLAIVGCSGCGKTVLLNLILGQLTPDRGRVLVANHAVPGARLCDVARLASDELDRVHEHWGVVFQRNALFSGSVLDNIALWLDEVKHLGDDEIRVIARRVLVAVGLPSDDDFLAKDHTDLSGGMEKRLAVARALSMDPTVIFYDEPTTGLDPVSAGQIQDLILTMHEGPERTDRTTIIITHDKDLLRRLRPRVLMLHEGRVFFDGGFERFEASESSVIRPYFDLMPLLHSRATRAG